MSSDCCFRNENDWFRYRAGALIVNDNRMLFVKCKFQDYYYVIGGGVKLGESSGDCIKRELLEEAGISVQTERLAVVCENFFRNDISGSKEVMDCHTIEFYYLVRLDDCELDNIKNITDEGEELVWIPLDNISTINIKPTFIKESISQIISSSEILHYIEETDR